MKVFPSKVDWWLAALTFVPMGVAVVSTAWVSRDGRAVAALIAVLAALALVIWVFGRTNYTIDGRTLIARSGPFRWRVPIDEIDSITPTRDPSSAPALSLDRLSIRYGARELLVSPRNREQFVAALRAMNPKIA